MPAWIERTSPTHKLCPRCEQTKPADEYHKRSKSPDGLYVWCKACAKEYQQGWYVDNKDLVRDQCRAWQNANPEKVAAFKRKHRYGMDQEQYEAMLNEQGGLCPICGVDLMSVKACVDHDHSCCQEPPLCGGCNRGIICSKCNSGLGFFVDSCANLAAACDYLTKYQERES